MSLLRPRHVAFKESSTEHPEQETAGLLAGIGGGACWTGTNGYAKTMRDKSPEAIALHDRIGPSFQSTLSAGHPPL